MVSMLTSAHASRDETGESVASCSRRPHWPTPSAPATRQQGPLRTTALSPQHCRLCTARWPSHRHYCPQATRRLRTVTQQGPGYTTRISRLAFAKHIAPPQTATAPSRQSDFRRPVVYLLDPRDVSESVVVTSLARHRDDRRTPQGNGAAIRAGAGVCLHGSMHDHIHKQPFARLTYPLGH